MSHYGDYVNETRGFEIVENDKGFATYAINGSECYIENIYVRPEFRKSGEARMFADHIKKKAIAAKCKFLTGSINLQIKDPETTMKTQLAYGFKIVVAQNNVIFLRMELPNE